MSIIIKNVTQIYGDTQQIKAIDDINLTIHDNEFIGLVGQTGSGKSTLVQLLNGLIKPTRGQVIVDNINITKPGVNWKEIRQKIGLVFQYPEHQLFEDTIFNDVAFGPHNLGLLEDEITERVKEALRLVGLDFKDYKDRSPFNLSGGQQRKVALAGVLAMKPQVLILDEPSAGLDPQGREQLIKLLKVLYEKYKITIILISHRMEEIAQLATRVLVLNKGRLVLDGSPEEVFSEVEKIRELALDLPEITEILWKLKQNGLDVRTDIFTVSEAITEILEKIRGTTRC